MRPVILFSHLFDDDRYIPFSFNGEHYRLTFNDAFLDHADIEWLRVVLSNKKKLLYLPCSGPDQLFRVFNIPRCQQRKETHSLSLLWQESFEHGRSEESLRALSRDQDAWAAFAMYRHRYCRDFLVQRYYIARALWMVTDRPFKKSAWLCPELVIFMNIAPRMAADWFMKYRGLMGDARQFFMRYAARQLASYSLTPTESLNCNAVDYREWTHAQHIARVAQVIDEFMLCIQRDYQCINYYSYPRTHPVANTTLPRTPQEGPVYFEPHLFAQTVFSKWCISNSYPGDLLDYVMSQWPRGRHSMTFFKQLARLAFVGNKGITNKSVVMVTKK